MVKMPGISLPKFSLPGLGRKKAGDAPGAADAISGRIGDAPKKKLAGKHIVGIGLVGLVVLGGGALSRRWPKATSKMPLPAITACRRNR